jgi:hypothetical protein
MHELFSPVACGFGQAGIKFDLEDAAAARAWLYGALPPADSAEFLDRVRGVSLRRTETVPLIVSVRSHTSAEDTSLLLSGWLVPRAWMKVTWQMGLQQVSIRSVAINCLLKCADGYVLTERSLEVSRERGQLAFLREGVNENDIAQGGEMDPAYVTLRLLNEELGVAGVDPRTLGYVVSANDVDILTYASTDLSFSQLLSAHARAEDSYEGQPRLLASMEHIRRSTTVGSGRYRFLATVLDEALREGGAT